MLGEGGPEEVLLLGGTADSVTGTESEMSSEVLVTNRCVGEWRIVTVFGLGTEVVEGNCTKWVGSKDNFGGGGAKYFTDFSWKTEEDDEEVEWLEEVEDRAVLNVRFSATCGWLSLF